MCFISHKCRRDQNFKWRLKSKAKYKIWDYFDSKWPTKRYPVLYSLYKESSFLWYVHELNMHAACCDSISSSHCRTLYMGNAILINFGVYCASFAKLSGNIYDIFLCVNSQAQCSTSRNGIYYNFGWCGERSYKSEIICICVCHTWGCIKNVGLIAPIRAEICSKNRIEIKIIIDINNR